MRNAKSRRNFFGSLFPIFLTPLLGGCGKQDRRPPGLRLLQDKRAKMRAGMSIAEVDALMAGHPRHESTVSYNSVESRELPRPCEFSVSYGDHIGATEGDYGLWAYFDQDGKLMDTSIAEYLN